MELRNVHSIFFLGLSAFLMLNLVVSCGDSARPMDIPANKVALEEVRKEPKIVEAVITDANVLYVTVKDDGTRRDGYAEYLCQLLKDQKATTKWVKVIKLGSSNDENKDNAYGVLLGESHCE